MVGALSPVVNDHHLLHVLNEHVLSSDEANGVCFRVHEVVVEGVDVNAELCSRLGADALLRHSQVVHDPHVLFHVSDVGGLVEVSGHVGV